VTDSANVEALLIDIDEEFDAMGYVGLYQFSWCQRSPDHRPPPDVVAATARAAYEEFRRRTPTTLVWLAWPAADPDTAVPADDDTVPVLDMDPDRPVSEPFLALIPA
jgi:hypothetical protein